ncbi:PUA-like domain-containing protein [Lactarius vividus]|nr:PUA-like domain-containing protein [Lactarius vividus]
MNQHWLMKAEPNSRIVKGKDVRFSVEDFEAVGTTPWEGVRNPEARNIMKNMRVGDKVLFYHSSCKTPGIAGFAEVTREAYPDYTAWDPEHPYYDPKSEENNPKWFMVDVKFVSRAAHFVPYPLLRKIAASGTTTPPAGLEYIGEKEVSAIREMDLVHRGRLSVQRVQPEAWKVIEGMAEKGGWTEETEGGGRTKKNREEASINGKRKNEESTDPDTDTRRRSKRRTCVKS